MIVFTKTFLDKEYKKVKRVFSIKDVISAIKRFAKGIRRKGETELSNFGVKGCKVGKLHVGRQDKGRLVVLLIVKDDCHIPILIRRKADKKEGYNISVELMEKQMIHLVESGLNDYKGGKFEIFE